MNLNMTLQSIICRRFAWAKLPATTLLLVDNNVLLILLLTSKVSFILRCSILSDKVENEKQLGTPPYLYTSSLGGSTTQYVQYITI